MGIDVQCLAGLRVGHDHEPDVRQLALAGIGEADRERLVSSREEAERLLPARHRKEVRDDEDERAALDGAERSLDELREGRCWRALQPGPSLHLVDEAQDLHPPTARGNDLLHVLAVQDRTDAVAVAREKAGDEADEIDEEIALVRARGPEVDGRRKVEQEMRRDLPVLEVLADVREVEAGGDVPVDVADVVAGDVLADVREIETLTAEQRPVIALQQTVQAPDDRPV